MAAVPADDGKLSEATQSRRSRTIEQAADDQRRSYLMANDDYIKNTLVGKKDIMEYAGLSKELYDKFRIEGVIISGKIYKMPVLVLDRRHYATKTNIDKYFNAVTMCDSSQIQDDGEDDI
jgi:hypothetical protein